MGRIHKEDEPLARLGFCQLRLQCLGLESFLCLDIGFGRDLSDFARFPPQGLEELPHLSRSPPEPRQVLNPLHRFRDTSGRALAKVGDKERPVVRQGTRAPRTGARGEFFQTADAVGAQIAVPCRWGNPTQPTYLGRRDALTLEVESFQFPLDSGVRVMKASVL